MRLLGFLFVLVLLVAVVGLYRGWFAVSTEARERGTNVSVEVDTQRMRQDANELAEVPEKVAAQVRDLGRPVGAGETAVEGKVAKTELATRRLTVDTGADTLEVDVPGAVRVERAGEIMAFEQLRPQERVRLRFRHDGDARKLAVVEALAAR
jgi:hypothetical protein